MHDLVILLDVDNTLLDNDRFGADLHARLTQDFGAAGCERYWDIYQQVREERGCVDYLETLQRFRPDLEQDPKLLQMSRFLLDYPFADRLYPHVFETLKHLGTLGLPVILSDGDVVFQPRKIQRTGLWDAVDGRVLITVHKQQCMDAVQRIYPAQHYAMVDDKPDLLAAMKEVMGSRLTTVLARQGHYANDAAADSAASKLDLTISHIAELRDLDAARLSAARDSSPPAT